MLPRQIATRQTILNPTGFAMTPFFRPAAALAACIALVLTVVPRAKASPADPFTVANVPVDVTAASAAIARLQAISKGQRDAYGILLHRLTLKSDWTALPKVNDETLENLVRSIEINDEHTSPIRYIAKLTVRFHPSKVEALLGSANIPYSESTAEPLLILPVFTSASGSVLWSDPNPWRTAWGQLPEGKGLLPLTVPLGDITDISTIDAKAALAGDTDKIAKIAARYSAGGVAVAVAAATPQGLSIKIREYGEDTGNPANVTVSGADTPDLFTKAVATTAGAIEETWKQATLLNPNNVAALSIVIPFANLKGWLMAERKLQNTPVIQSLDLTSFSRTQAEVTLHYLGSVQGLALTLAQHRLNLINQNGYWLLRPAAPPAAGATKGPDSSAPSTAPAASTTGSGTSGPSIEHTE